MNVTPSADLVSIVIPTYRRPDFVRAAAESALAQTWTNIEVIVVSDGPDEDARAALEGLDARLRYLELPKNLGPAMARNAGVIASRGEWLAFLDDDDLMLRDKVEQQMQLADRNRPERIVACRVLYQRGKRRDIWPSVPIAKGQDLADYILRRPSLLRRPGIVPIQTLLVHRSILTKVPFQSHRDHEDWAWLMEAWHLAGARVVFAWAALVVYNIDTEGISRSRRLNWEESLAWAERYRPWIGDRAFCSFLATKTALKAKRAGDTRALRLLMGKVLRNNPGPLELFFLFGTIMLPEWFLHRAWKRSLISTRSLEPSISEPVQGI